MDLAARCFLLCVLSGVQPGTQALSSMFAVLLTPVGFFILYAHAQSYLPMQSYDLGPSSVFVFVCVSDTAWSAVFCPGFPGIVNSIPKYSTLAWAS